jgi:hypothetical protein
MSQSFISKLTPEKKKLRELKFNIYITAQLTTSNSRYICIIVDKNSNKKVLSNRIEDTYVLAFIQGLIDGIESILDTIEEKYHKYCLVNIKSDNIFFLTLVTDWIKKWKQDNFKDHQFGPQLKTLFTLLCNINFKTNLIYKTSDEYAWFLDKKVNDLKELEISN